MEINWQDVFYFTSSLMMITVFFALIWVIWLIKNLMTKVQQWNHDVDEIKYFISNVKLKVSKFLLKILNKRIDNKTK